MIVAGRSRISWPSGPASNPLATVTISSGCPISWPSRFSTARTLSEVIATTTTSASLNATAVSSDVKVWTSAGTGMPRRGCGFPARSASMIGAVALGPPEAHLVAIVCQWSDEGGAHVPRAHDGNS